ncbi:MAG: DUF3291 domain-containing protein [Caulobacterales bacterium]|jgi:hypothetical protein
MHLAQINVAKIVHDMDGPQMADFVAALDNINALADRSPGFVWRLIGDGGDATDVRFGDESDLLINMSVWADIESLRAFVYKTAHGAVMARRGKWFPALGRPHMALWWVAEGAAPTLADAFVRLQSLAAHGPTAFAFTFDHPFDAAGQELALAPITKDCA